MKAASRPSVGILLAFGADVLDEVAERRRFGDFERPLKLVHHFDALGLHGFGDADDGVRTGAAPDFVGVNRRVQRVQLQIRVVKEVTDLRDLRPVVVVQVLAGAEKLHGRDAGLPDSLQPDSGQAVVGDQVGRKGVLHGRS